MSKAFTISSSRIDVAGIFKSIDHLLYPKLRGKRYTFGAFIAEKQNSRSNLDHLRCIFN